MYNDVPLGNSTTARAVTGNLASNSASATCSAAAPLSRYSTSLLHHIEIMWPIRSIHPIHPVPFSSTKMAATALHPTSASSGGTSGISPSLGTAEMPSEQKSFLSMLQRLPESMVNELDFDGVVGFIRHLFIEHIIPAVLFAAAFVALYNLGLVVSRIVWPPSAREIHDEAVKLLKKDAALNDTDSASSASGGSRRAEALKLLHTAIEKDPDLEAAYITLASELIYGGGGKDIDQAITLLQDAKKRFPKSDEVIKLSQEAGAIKKFGKSSGAEAASAKMRKMAEVGRFPLR